MVGFPRQIKACGLLSYSFEPALSSETRRISKKDHRDDVRKHQCLLTKGR